MRSCEVRAFYSKGLNEKTLRATFPEYHIVRKGDKYFVAGVYTDAIESGGRYSIQMDMRLREFTGGRSMYKYNMRVPGDYFFADRLGEVAIERLIRMLERDDIAILADGG